jgi:RNA polymerase sigma factor (TIGR02999 family)
MRNPRQHEITQILLELSSPEADRTKANERLYEAVYDELRRIADRLMRAERSDHTLQPTALVHEAYIRMVDQTRVQWQDRAHFFAIAARVMRRVLVDHARRKARQKRGGGKQLVTWDSALGIGQDPCLETIALDRVLTQLSKLDQRMEQIVELRVFGGMTLKEIAQALGVSRRTVDDDWMVAKKWLAHELAG